LNVKKNWSFNANEPIMGISIGTLTHSKKTIILVYTKFGKILLLTPNGQTSLEQNITENKAIWNGFIEDINNDGELEIIIGGLDGLLRVFKLTGDIHLKLYWDHQFGASISGMLIEDINDDGIKEIVAYSLDKSIRVLNPFDGSLIWGQLFEEGVSDAKVCRGINNDKPFEIIASSNDGTIRAFETTKGELLWFKRFENKVRTISCMNVKSETYIFCGGDDKKLHFLNLRTKQEIKTIPTHDYIWKSLSYPPNFNNNLLISTYSFAFFDKNIPIENIEFISEVIALDSNFNVKWNLKNINAEVIDYIEIFDAKYILIGSTKGELYLINELNGEILVQIKHDSCINDIKYDLQSKLLFTCHDDGKINAYTLSYD
jgi:WD40 repeat protein